VVSDPLSESREEPAAITDAATFGGLVKALREAQHLNQDDLAALMGMSAGGGRVTVAYWENGQRRPKPEQLPKLAACLGYWPIHGDLDLRRDIVLDALTQRLVAS
jgi:transcriptional regulator with XRE-family HTH domain